MLALAIIPVPFVLIGAYFLGTFLHFKLKGETVRGEIIGYKKYIARGTKNSSQLMYAPIFEYSYMGEKSYLQGAGSTAFIYPIGRGIILKILHRKKEHVLPMTFTYPLFGGVFFLIGSVCLSYFYSSPPTHDWFVFIPPILFFAIPYSVFKYLKKKNLLKQLIEDHFKNSSFVETIEGEDFLLSKNDITNEKRKHKFLGLIISMAFLIFNGFVGHTLWKKLSWKSQNIFKNPDLWSEIPFHNKPPLEMIFVFVVLLGVVMLISLTKQLRT